MTTIREQREADATQLRDALRGELHLLGAAPEAVTLAWPDDRPRIALSLTPMIARFVLERLDPSTVQARACPAMILWDERRACLAQVVAVTNEYASLDRIGRHRIWRAPLSNLRPPLHQEIRAALRGFASA